jgi:hypothetical protein
MPVVESVTGTSTTTVKSQVPACCARTNRGKDRR